MKIKPKYISPIVYFVYKLWCKSLRIKVFGRETVNSFLREKKPMVFSLWHDEVLPLMYIKEDLPIIAIVSQSNDGEYMADLLESLGHKTVRGSSSRGGIAALLRAAKTMKNEGYFACITVDGPRGPRHVAKEGAIFLANKTPAHIVPMRTFYKKAITFKSWDKFQLPLPFSQVHVIFGEPYTVPEEKISMDYVKAETQRLTDTLNAMENPQEFSLRDSYRYKLLHKMARALSYLSLEQIHSVARCIGKIWWFISQERKKVAVRAIVKHLEKTEEQAELIAKESFEQNFVSFSEIFLVQSIYEENKSFQFGESPGLQRLQEDTGPIVIATAHIGSWELMEAYAARLKPEKERLVVVRNRKDSALSQLTMDLRSAGGVTAIGHRQASTEALQCLRNKGLVAFLVDHNTSRNEAIFLPFLNDIAAVNLGPAVLALRAKANIYPSFLLRSKTGLILQVDEPLETKLLMGTMQERLKVIASYYTKSVENCVKQYPEQWFWMHKRWKTRPDE